MDLHLIWLVFEIHPFMDEQSTYKRQIQCSRDRLPEKGWEVPFSSGRVLPPSLPSSAVLSNSLEQEENAKSSFSFDVLWVAWRAAFSLGADADGDGLLTWNPNRPGS